MIRLAITFVIVVQTMLGTSGDFAQRREKLRQSSAPGVTVLFGNKESDDLHQGFFQEPNFFYLTGWEEPGAILVLTTASDKAAPNAADLETIPREILFLPQRNLPDEKWTGRKLGPLDGDVAQRTGFATVLPTEQFESEFRKLLEAYTDIGTVKANAATSYLEKLAPMRTVNDVTPALNKLRMVKSGEEIAAIQKATDASVDAHRAAWKALAPGKFEYQIAAVMIETYMNEGCQRDAYTPIVGSGPNSTTLHYSRNNRRMDAGEVVVMDVAGEYNNYASDITRTAPANGHYTARQKEIYEIVLGAQNAAIAAIKPGVTIRDLYKIARGYIDTHGKDTHGDKLGKYFIHGLSHHVGLDVHDASDQAASLAENMVITVEPGIYIPEENIGVRIEDIVLVTKEGSRVMSAALPKDPAQVEQAMAANAANSLATGKN